MSLVKNELGTTTLTVKQVCFGRGPSLVLSIVVFLACLKQEHIWCSAAPVWDYLRLHQLLVDTASSRRCGLIWRMGRTLEWEHFVVVADMIVVRLVGRVLSAPICKSTTAVFVVQAASVVQGWVVVGVSTWYHMVVKLLLHNLIRRRDCIVFTSLICVQVLIYLLWMLFNDNHAGVSLVFSNVIAFLAQLA